MKKRLIISSFLLATTIFMGCSNNKPVEKTQEVKKEVSQEKKDIETATRNLFRSQRKWDISAAGKAIQNGADINAYNSSGNTLLLEIVQSRDINYDYFMYILSHSPNLYLENKSDYSEGNMNRGKTVAMMTDDPAVINILADEGYDFNRETSIGLKPLPVAVKSKTLPITQAMVEAGANPNVTDKAGTPVLTLAVFEKKLDLVYLLINSGANINALDKAGNPAIVFASTPDIIFALLDNGANLDFTTPDDKYVLHEVFMLAVDNNYATVIQRLLEEDIDLNFIDSFGDTPATLAAKKNNLQLLKLLIDNGANPNVNGKDGKNVMMIAQENGYVDIINYLLTLD